jgi:hypothetical protein
MFIFIFSQIVGGQIMLQGKTSVQILFSSEK